MGMAEQTLPARRGRFGGHPARWHARRVPLMIRHSTGTQTTRSARPGDPPCRTSRSSASTRTACTCCSPDAEGHRYTVPLDDSLRAAARRDRPRLGQLQIEQAGGLRPAAVQSMIRAGLSAEEVADRAGWTVEKVHKYEGPILAEREHVAGLARQVRLRSRGGSHGASTTLEARVAERLRSREIDPAAVRWDSRRADKGEWIVALAFAAGGREREALWRFDPLARVVTALDDESRWLSEDDDTPAPGPLPAPHLAPPSGPASVYDVEAEGGGWEPRRGAAAPAAPPGPPPRPAAPLPDPPRAPRRRLRPSRGPRESPLPRPVTGSTTASRSTSWPRCVSATPNEAVGGALAGPTARPRRGAGGGAAARGARARPARPRAAARAAPPPRRRGRVSRRYRCIRPAGRRGRRRAPEGVDDAEQDAPAAEAPGAAPELESAPEPEPAPAPTPEPAPSRGRSQRSPRSRHRAPDAIARSRSVRPESRSRPRRRQRHGARRRRTRAHREQVAPTDTSPERAAVSRPTPRKGGRPSVPSWDDIMFGRKGD